MIVDFIYVLRNMGRIRESHEIIAIGPMAWSIALLLKTKLLPSCTRVYWFGLFIHNPRWLRFLRPAFRFLDSNKIRYVLFSDFERLLYGEALLLLDNRMFYVPYGVLSGQRTLLCAKAHGSMELEEKRFFFSGGYSNRDYLSLIKMFSVLPFKLVIICAALNTEVEETKVSPNIKVLRDAPSEVFDAYVKSSCACIIPIAHNTGAAGQSCLLRYMKYRKIIIATDTGVIREYITDGVSGILVKDNNEAMARAVGAVDANIESYQSYADAAYERFTRVFSGEAIERRLDEMLRQDDRQTQADE